MSESAGSDSLHHSGDDSDNEGSVACSDASEMMTDIGRKRTRKTPQVLGSSYAWHEFGDFERQVCFGCGVFIGQQLCFLSCE
jgi:hypothetical protein